MDSKRILNKINQKGVSILPMLLILSVVLFIGQQAVFYQINQGLQDKIRVQNNEAQVYLISMLETLVAEEISLRNSRFSSNNTLYQCLFANPSPCDERQDYDMSLYAPNPPVIYQGGDWPHLPTGIPQIAGGLNSNKFFYNKNGGKCAQSGLNKPTPDCPLQAILTFRPLCGGSPSVPEYQSTRGVCPGRANGFDITIGVGVLRDSGFIYKANTTIRGDARLYRIRALTFIN